MDLLFLKSSPQRAAEKPAEDQPNERCEKGGNGGEFEDEEEQGRFGKDYKEKRKDNFEPEGHFLVPLGPTNVVSGQDKRPASLSCSSM